MIAGSLIHFCSVNPAIITFLDLWLHCGIIQTFGHAWWFIFVHSLVTPFQVEEKTNFDIKLQTCSLLFVTWLNKAIALVHFHWFVILHITLHTSSSVCFCNQLFIKYFFQSLRAYVFFTLQNLSVFTTLSMYSSLFNSNCCNGHFHVLNLYCSSVYIILKFTYSDYIWIFKNILEDDAEYNLGIYKVFNAIIGDSLSVTFLIAGK